MTIFKNIHISGISRDKVIIEMPAIIMPIIGIIAGIVLLGYGFRRLKMKRLVENTPTSKIRSLAMGFVEIYGEALARDKPLRCPLSKSECVYYKVLIEEERGSGKNRRWVKVYTDTSKEKFYIKDDTGKILIDPANAEMAVKPDRISQSGFGKDPDKNIMDFLAEKHIRFEGIFGINKTMRYYETFIAPKDKVYVMGEASINPEIKVTSTGHENLIIKKGDKGNIFYISDSPEKNLLKTLRTGILVGIGGGSLIIVVLGSVLIRLLLT